MSGQAYAKYHLLKYAVVHDLRHTFATRMVQRGVDIYKVSKLLDHRDLKSTTRYSHHSPESLRDGVEVLENIGEMEQKNKNLTTF